MPHLILIKHARPERDDRAPSHAWPLSAAGRGACKPLADALRHWSPAAIVSSEEPKALQTAELLAPLLGIAAPSTDAALGEHDRRNVPNMATRDFIAANAQFFQQPARRVLGGESAQQAAMRFEAAVDRAIAAHPGQTVAIVTHAAVMALFAAAHGDVDPFQYWRRMQLPSLSVYALPSWEMVETVDRVEV